ncbi:MAG: hypothetical protein A2Z21_06335 [Candidatus Fraserbacteria bacterium RBG_16_55_9]|uniref:Sec-independent protein translocase protein TatA n=1 Tax=Fraserbacteria sp. (strain RBG_16_55_9) TaxID=1817864 RepID=A0A1F5UZV8_FRAXR|nr:MAG: hypothetical protein A2Z21_06335 [Candidatus Fraserbacteria bacterium RBG_16_55_9]
MDEIKLVYALIGLPELLLLFALVFLLFGSSKLPGLARAVGNAVRSFRDEAKKTRDQDELEPPEEPNVERKSSG